MLKGVISRDEVAPFTSGMTTARWVAEVGLEEVFIEDLWATQDGIHFAALRADAPPPVGGDPYPHLVAADGRLAIEDGHSRITRAALAGEKMIVARVLRCHPPKSVRG